MQQRPFLLPHHLVWRSSSFCPRSYTFYHVHHPTKYSHLKSLNHHLYADDTQLFFSFYPPDLHSSISHLQTALQEISSWIAANLLTLNSSNLLIGLKQQLAKIQNCSLSTTHSAHNLGFIFDEHLSFSDQITALSKSCNFHIRHLRCICPFLSIKTAITIATSVVHSKLNYCNSLYYNLPNSQVSRLQHIQNSLARAQVLSHHSYSQISPLAKSQRTYRI